MGQTAGEHAVETNSRGQAVIGDTALEFVQGANAAVAGLPEPVVNTINSINSGKPLPKQYPDWTWQVITPWLEPTQL